MKVEICINSDHHVKQSVAAAYRGGADTVELCSRMDLDGLTPTLEQIAVARAAFTDKPGLMVMIRPRGGDFCYSQAEIEQMEREIKTAVSLGADGVVFGALKNGALDVNVMKQLARKAQQYNLITTCHRAFDAVSEPVDALQKLIALGISRVLTNGTPWGSGQPLSQGIPRLQQLIQQANNQIEIVVGGGIHQKNLPHLLNQLSGDKALLSVHIYSAAIHQNKTNWEKVQEIVNLVNQ